MNHEWIGHDQVSQRDRQHAFALEHDRQDARTTVQLMLATLAILTALLLWTFGGAL